MRRRITCRIVVLTAAALAAGGCASSPDWVTLYGIPFDDPGIRPVSRRPEATMVFALGAGDGYGEMVHEQYLASLDRSNGAAFAEATTDAPID